MICLISRNREKIPTSRTGTIDGYLCMLVIYKESGLCNYNQACNEMFNNNNFMKIFLLQDLAQSMVTCP